MNLQNGFSKDDRSLYMGVWYCWGITPDGSYCGSNGSNCGGLELHHIMGRRKQLKCLSSILNSALLCKKCHDKVTHSMDEHRQLFLKTMKFLKAKGYVFKKVDIEFLNVHAQELLGTDAQVWAML